MLQRFKLHIQQQHLLPSGQQVLLAVSGGIDSSVLAHLMFSAGYPFAIAHCNFHLRPGDCDRDEQFVRQLAEQYGVPIHVAQFDTADYAHQHHQSIEEAARVLRYGYFEQLLSQHGYGAILTAHHRDDAAETFFINLLRGTGLSGLHGILPVNGHLVRPLLPFSREEIEQYALQHHLQHVEDHTNASLDYRRNQIRHLLMPLLRQIQPTADHAIQQTIAHLQSVEQLYDGYVHILHQQRVHPQPDGTIEMDIEGTTAQELFELLHPYGFNSATIQTVHAATRSGSQYLSPQYRAVYDRGRLVLTPACPSPDMARETAFSCRLTPLAVPFEQYRPQLLQLPPSRAVFDADTVVLPVRLRPWHVGDRFHPLGVNGTQLVSDYFSDHKFSLLDKQRQLLLVDADDHILWIVGRRTSHPHRVTPSTTSLLEVEVEKIR